MANIKQFLLPYFVQGATGLYCRILQMSTGYFLDDSDGIFRVSAVDPKVLILEYAPGTSLYYFTENRTVWADGKYSIFGYDSSDNLFAGGDLFILNDAEVSESDLLSYMSFIKKMEEGDWVLDDEENTWTVMDSDGSTPIATFNCFDKDGNPSVVNIFRRTRV